METSKWRVVWKGLTLSLVLNLLMPPVWAQERAQQNGPPVKDKAFMGLPNLLASRVSPANFAATDEKGEQAPKRIPAEKDPAEKDPVAKKAPASGGSTAPADPPADPPGGNAPPTPAGAEDPPLGFAGPNSVRVNKPKTEEEESGDFIPVDDRWRVGFPDWDRHGDFSKADYPFTKGRLINPYRQNVLKGDYPVIGYDKFFTLIVKSETFLNTRRIPVPADVSSQRPDQREFFGRTGQFLFSQNFIVAADFFQGDASFKPVDWRLHALFQVNLNYAYGREKGVFLIDQRRGNTRSDNHVTLQEGFVEYRLGDTTRILPFLRGKGSQGGYSPYYDTSSVRTGIQLFNSDFRGFIFNDTNLGVRLFGNFASNRYQYNAVYFDMLEKDTNSGLNTFNSRAQRVIIANLYRQDTFKKGYTVQFSYHHNRTDPTRFNDRNGFPVRPVVIGNPVPNKIRTHYIGFTSDGHFGERLPSFLGKIGGGLNLSTAFYQVLGTDSFNPIAGRKQDVNAQLAAAELSVDRDWLRVRATFFYSSGDGDPTDGDAHGFDSILDDNNFAGGKFSFFNSQEIRLTQTGTALVSPNSLIPHLRSSKIHGNANHVNPGLFLYSAGADLDLTQKLRLVTNINFLRFARTEALELVLFQPQIEKSLGIDYHVGFKYRPKLNDNIILFYGVSLFRTGAGFTSIYTSNCNPNGPVQCGTEQGNKTLFNLFATIKFTY
jgi:hypothetical protein